jgi:hypothetical protein
MPLGSLGSHQAFSRSSRFHIRHIRRIGTDIQQSLAVLGQNEEAVVFDLYRDVVTLYSISEDPGTAKVFSVNGFILVP